MKKKGSFGKLFRVLLIVFLLLLAGALGYTGTTWLSVRNINQNAAATVQQFKQDKTTKINGHDILGTITIDKLDLEYPIIKYVDETSLNIAICAFAGPGLNQSGNTLLWGKRTKNGLFFANLGKLKANDTVQITGKDGVTLTYRLIDSYTTSITNKGIFEASFAGEICELTLTSVSRNGAKRYVFKFIEMKPAE